MFTVKVKIVLIAFLFLGSHFTIAQNSDCDQLKMITDTFHYAKNVSGYGNKKEFSGNSLDSKLTFEEERNSIWYLLKMPAAGIFTFDIIAEHKNDDWDFLLYERKTMFCKRIEDGKIKPIRSNLSRSAITGLSKTSNDEFSVAGLNNNYSKYLQVEKGEEFVLVVNNPKRSGGSHQLILHFPKLLEQKTEDIKEVEVEKNQQPKIDFTLVIKDKITGEKVSSMVNISGLKRKVLSLDHITDYSTQLYKKNHKLTIDVAAKGYMLISVPVAIKKSSTKAHSEIELEKIKTGSRANLKNIQFYPGKSAVLPKASGSVGALLEFMKLNEKVTIEIEGHVNGPFTRNKKEFQNLSENRAKAIKEYLVVNGIDESRINALGYGNTRMLYPEPKTEKEEAANRRVEILIKSEK